MAVVIDSSRPGVIGLHGFILVLHLGVHIRLLRRKIFGLAGDRRLVDSTVRDAEAPIALGEVRHFGRCWALGVVGVSM